MYQQHSMYHRRPRRFGSYFLPFLSLIILGLIVVLVFQIVGYFQEKHSQALENKAAVKLVAGRASMKIWGVDQWTNALDGSILKEGDSIKTDPGSRVVLTLLNGSVIRLNSETEVSLAALKTKDAEDSVALSLANGEIWLKRSENDTVRADFKVTTPHLEVTSFGTIFNVSKKSNGEEAVRVISGKVQVAIHVDDSDTGKDRVAETLDVALGQEVSVSPSDIAALQNRKNVELLALLSDGFRTGDWYSWNRLEDASGTSSMNVAVAVQNKAENPTPLAPPQQEVTAVLQNTLSLTAPVILTPKQSDRTVQEGHLTIEGSVSSATDKVEVTTHVAGKDEPYILARYASGSEHWSYVVDPQYGNLIPGSNRFSIVAIDKDGKRSESTEVKILYDKPREPSDLSAPVVTNYNGSKDSETIEDAVKVEGTIGKGIVKLYVDDFILTRFVPDSGTWLYYAKTGYGNLKEGENVYHIYGMDSDGKTTPATKFTIIKKPKPTAEGTTTTSAEVDASAHASTPPPL